MSYQLLIMLALLFLPAKAGYALYDDLPELGEISATYITPNREKELGKIFMKEVRSRVQILDDPIIVSYIQNLGDQLVVSSNTKNKKFHFFVVKDPTINAFAGPNAYVGINTGTIITSNSESELAAVMAHEIAHVSQHHIERLIRDSKITSMASMAGLLAASIVGAVSGSTTVSNVASGAAVASAGGALQHLINFTREHEIEADNIGMGILYRSGFDPNAMPDFFSRMQRSNLDQSNDIPKFFLTHPVTSDRIADAKNRAAHYSKRPGDVSTNFGLIKARAEILTSRNLKTTLKELRKKLNETKQPKAALKYEYALALYKTNELIQASERLTILIKEYPKQILFKMLAAEIALEKKEFDQAINIIKAGLDDQPNYFPLVMQYGHALYAAKRFSEACKYLRKKSRKFSSDPSLYRLLAQAYAENHDTIDAYQAKAKAYEIDGFYRQAAILLLQALKSDKLTKNERLAIKAKVERLRTLGAKS